MTRSPTVGKLPTPPPSHNPAPLLLSSMSAAPSNGFAGRVRLARYRSSGWGALQARALKGRPMKVQAAQMRWLYRTVTGKSPLQFRFEFALWTREMIRVLLREQFDLKLSVASVGRLLKQLGLSCQRPLFRAIKQDPKRVRRWLKQEYPLIRRQARAVGADIYFGDEAGVRSDNHAGTTWGIKGQTPVVRSTGQRSSVNMISAVSARGHMRFMVAKGRVNGAVFVEFLKRLMHSAAQPIFLILDGGSYHRSRLVKDYVASLNGKLRLFFLPPNPRNSIRTSKSGIRSEEHTSELQ